ncbi:hypothetical protein Tco_0040028 [Tanacetum coccineum]
MVWPVMEQDDRGHVLNFVKFLIRTPRATRTPNPKVVQKKRKGKQVKGDESSPKPYLKIRIRQKKSTLTTPVPHSDDREIDKIIKATKLCLALDKTTNVYEEQHNVAAVEKKILEENVEKLVKEEDEYDGDDFVDIVLLSDEESDDRIKHESHKEKPEEIVDDEKKDDDVKHNDAKNNKDDDDDDNDDDHNDQSLIRTQRTGSLEIRTTKMQAPIPSPPRSPRTNLYSDKAII